MGLFNFKKVEEEKVSIANNGMTTQELKDVLLGGNVNTEVAINRDTIKQIPAFKSAIDLISSIIASLPIVLYKHEDGEVVRVIDDERLFLLNLECNHLSSAYASKKAMIEDYLINGKGFLYMNKDKNKVKSLVQVDAENITFLSNFNVLEPDLKLCVSNGENKELYDFVCICNGATPEKSKGLIHTNADLIATMLLSLNQEKKLGRTGGVNRGILTAKSRLSQPAIDTLKQAWKNLYSDDNNNAIVLNDGIEFQNVSSNAKDMQLNENKKVNSNHVYSLLNIPVDLVNQPTEENFQAFLKLAIDPILTLLEQALCISMLKENEKGKLFFKIDTSEILKSDIEKRFKAWEIALKNSILTVDEIRAKENLTKLPNIGSFVKLNLADVLYNPATNEIFNTNSSTTTNLNEGTTPKNNLEVENV